MVKINDKQLQFLEVCHCQVASCQFTMSVDPKSRETRQRLDKCWSLEIDWDLFPKKLREVHV